MSRVLDTWGDGDFVDRGFIGECKRDAQARELWRARCSVGLTACNGDLAVYGILNRKRSQCW